MIIAGLFHARDAGQMFCLQDAGGLVVGAGVAWIAGTVHGDDRTLKSRSDVERAGIVGDDEIGLANPFNHLRERSAASEIEATVRGNATNDFGKRAIAGDTEDGEVQMRVLRGEARDGFGEKFHGPTFVLPARAREKHDATWSAERRAWSVRDMCGRIQGASREPVEFPGEWDVQEG